MNSTQANGPNLGCKLVPWELARSKNKSKNTQAQVHPQVLGRGVEHHDFKELPGVVPLCRWQ